MNRGIACIGSIEKDIMLYIQPIFNIKTMEAEYGEVLTRIKGLDMSIEKFFRDVSDSGNGLELDKIIIKKACKFIKDNKAKRQSKIKLTVNLSEGSLNIKDLYKEVLKIMDDNQLDSNDILLELNENVNYRSRKVLKNIKGLEKCKIGLVMDDFGEGNAVIKNLSKVNVGMLKFSKKFAGIDKADEGRLKQLVNSMHELGIITVIEGVETEEQLENVKRIGYMYLQGYVWQRPIEMEDFANLYMY